ncbi:MAG TPA: aminoacyl-tRNA hydrolase [Candidatus Omnitrophota bacterium]|nr:aminoacyl-tRNA hydrolase [Candidatus Omnitrophota bacterium]
MKLIVGLGNPGILYANSRHNIGAMAVNALAKETNAPLRRERTIPARTAKAFFEKEAVTLAVPLTYMNLSGAAVAPLLRHTRTAVQDLIVVYDDLDLDMGVLRLRPAGSAGGHNGMKSIIAALGTDDFCRLRIGIGRPARRDADVARYVLSSFGRRERKALDEAIENACNCLQSWAVEGTTRCMNIYNR